MESNEGHLKGASQAEWFLMKAKVALAVAIMKNTPSGTSGREYLEALVCKLKSQDESWKEKAQGLQQEVLRLRQELLITKMTSNTKSSTETAGQDATMDDMSQDLFGPGSETCSADLQSGSETPELLQQDPQPAITSLQPSVTSSCYRSLCGKAMPHHVQLLQSLCSLHQVEGNNRGLESLWFSPNGGAGSLLVDSVCQLLDSVVAVCRDPSPLGPSDVLLQACQVAAQALDLFCSQRLPSVEFTGRVEESLRELTGLLLHSNQLSRPRLQAPEKLMEYLITLGSSSMSKSFLIRHILSQISALADQLWQAFQGQESSGLDKFPVDQHHNSCYLFCILEELLQKSETQTVKSYLTCFDGSFRLRQRCHLMVSDVSFNQLTEAVSTCQNLTGRHRPLLSVRRWRMSLQVWESRNAPSSRFMAVWARFLISTASMIQQ